MDGHDQTTARKRASNFARARELRAAQWHKWQSDAEPSGRTIQICRVTRSPSWSKGGCNFPNKPAASRAGFARSSATDQEVVATDFRLSGRREPGDTEVYRRRVGATVSVMCYAFCAIRVAEQRLAHLADFFRPAAANTLRMRAGNSTSLIGVSSGSSGVGSSMVASLISPSPSAPALQAQSRSKTL